MDIFVEQLIEAGGVLSQIVSHMYANESGERPVPEVLHSLLVGVLRPVCAKAGEADVAVAGRVLADAVERITAEVFLVPASEMNRQARRAAGRSRRRG